MVGKKELMIHLMKKKPTEPTQSGKVTLRVPTDKEWEEMIKQKWFVAFITKITKKKANVKISFNKLKAYAYGLSHEQYFLDKLFGEYLDEQKHPKIIFRLIIAQDPVRPFTDKMFKFLFNFKFGNCYLGLQINECILEWVPNKCSLIVPRSLLDGTAVFVFNIEHSNPPLSVPNTKEHRETIVKTILEFNRNKKYNGFNCYYQTFIDEMISNLGLKPNYPKPIKRYFDGLRKDSNKNAKPHYFKGDQQIFFNSHKELDDFVNSHKKFDDDMNDCGSDLFTDELMLYKSFDRGFWLKFLHDDSDEACKPYNCPFNSITGGQKLIDSSKKSESDEENDIEDD